MSAGNTTSRLMAFLFTDLVNSTGLKEELGDAEYVRAVAQPHNALFRQLLARFPDAVENNYTGDGFLATFNSVTDGLNLALLFHHALSERSWDRVRPQTRIGIHLGEATEFADPDQNRKQLAGQAVDLAARVMSLATGGQTLLTRAAFDSARQYVRAHPAAESVAAELEWLAHGRYVFKGKDEPMEVFEVGLKGVAPLRPPADSEKAKRADSLEEQQMRGWRPALDMEIPRRPGWRIAEKLGEGGFGEVWLARHERTKEERVFKFCFDPDRLRSFKRELTLFRLMREHLGDRDDIARLLEVQVDQPPFFLESEYIQSGNLCQWSERRGGLSIVPLEMRLRLLGKIARTLAAAHSLGIIHKDLKPSNVFMREESDGSFRPILADFGIGVLLDRSLLHQHQITETGFTESVVVAKDSSGSGTRLYAPPESQVGKPATTAGDIYALGVMLYQFVIGDLSRPLGVGWEEDVTDDLLREDIMACTHRDPARRLPSAADLAEKLERFDARRSDRDSQRRAEAERLEAQQRAERATQRTRQLRRALTGSLSALAFAAIAVVVILNKSQQLAAVKHGLEDTNKKLASTNAELQRANEAERNANKEAELKRQEAEAALAREKEANIAALLVAAPSEVRHAIDRIKPYRSWAEPRLDAVVQDQNRPFVARLHAALALCAFGKPNTHFLAETLAQLRADQMGNVQTAFATARERAASDVLTALDSHQSDDALRVKVASILLSIGQSEPILDWCRPGCNTTFRTAFVHHFAEWMGDADGISERLDNVKDYDMQAMLCLAFGFARSESLLPTEAERLEAWLWDLYLASPSGAVHSSAAWTLQRWRVALPKTEPGAQGPGERDWYVNSVGMVMTTIPTGQFKRQDKPQNGATTNVVTISRQFWLATTEVTKAQYARFLDENPAIRDVPDWEAPSDEISPSLDCPAQNVTWYEAIKFCNWLSSKEGLDPCYTHVGETWGCDFGKSGYRLPTEAEWEYASRSGSVGGYCFGDRTELLSHYAWIRSNAHKQAHPVAQLLPNAWGMFDMHGNILEWCWDKYFAYPNIAETNPTGPVNPPARMGRTARGGDWIHDDRDAMSGDRGPFLETWRDTYIGFRVARSHTKLREKAP